MNIFKIVNEFDWKTAQLKRMHTDNWKSFEQNQDVGPSFSLMKKRN